MQQGTIGYPLTTEAIEGAQCGGHAVGGQGGGLHPWWDCRKGTKEKQITGRDGGGGVSWLNTWKFSRSLTCCVSYDKFLRFQQLVPFSWTWNLRLEGRTARRRRRWRWWEDGRKRRNEQNGLRGGTDKQQLFFAARKWGGGDDKVKQRLGAGVEGVTGVLGYFCIVAKWRQFLMFFFFHLQGTEPEGEEGKKCAPTNDWWVRGLSLLE